MRRSLWVLITLTFIVVVSPNAHADTYNPNFTCTTPCGSVPFAPPVSVTAAGTTVDVSYYGYPFPIYLLSGSNLLDLYVWYGIDTTTINSPFRTLSFDISDTSTGVDQYLIISVPDDFGVLNHRESGSLVFTPVETPEPGSLVLSFAGLGALLLLAKRLR